VGSNTNVARMLEVGLFHGGQRTEPVGGLVG
jgi:hypothetical protein